MINISKSGNAIKFVFTDSDHYLYGNGEIEVPVNSLSLIVDESNMVTFRKANSNDIFLSFNPSNSNLSDKAGVIDFYKSNMVGSTGGGSGSGMTPSEVQEMIDESVSGKADTAVVNQAISEATAAILSVSGDVQTNAANIRDINDTIDAKEEVIASALTEVRQDVADIDVKEEVIASALTEVRQNKQDVLTAGQGIDITNNVISSTVDITVDPTLDTGSTNPVANSAITTAINAKQDALHIYTENRNTGTAELHSNNSSIIFNAGGAYITANNLMGINTFNVASTGVTINGENVATESYVTSAISGKADTSAVTAVNDALTAHTADTGIHVSAQEKNAWNAKAEPYSAGTGIEISGNVISATGGGGSVTVDPTLDTGSTNPVANSAITTAIDNAKAYYISFATIATTGIRDEDWDGIVAAIDDHRPIYAGYPKNNGGILYYGVECMNKNGNNTQIILTSSDDSSHYFYTFTKNGSNDYSYTVETRPYTTDAEKDAWNAKQDALSAGTGIEISGNVISATGGGGTTYSAGTNISIDTANTINCTLNASNATGSGSLKLASYGGTNATGVGSVATGYDTQVGGNYSFGSGRASKTSNYGEASFGFYNKSNGTSSSASQNSGNTLFSVGNGTGTLDNQRHNAFEIRQNGDIYVNDGTNDVRLQDTILALGGLKLVKLTQAEYDALATKDANTLYIISNVVS